MFFDLSRSSKRQKRVGRDDEGSSDLMTEGEDIKNSNNNKNKKKGCV